MLKLVSILKKNKPSNKIHRCEFNCLFLRKKILFEKSNFKLFLAKVAMVMDTSLIAVAMETAVAMEAIDMATVA